MKSLLEVDHRIKPTKDLLDEPVIIRVTEFTEESAEDFADDISLAHRTGQPVIPVIIDSYGGYVYSLLSMIADIQNSKLPVATIAVGKAMSCGSILLSCGNEGYRFIDKNATVMVHDVSSMAWGKNEELKASVKQTDRLNKQVFGLMAKNCGQDKDYFLKIIHDKSHAEWYLSPAEAKKHNLVNEIRVPDLMTRISVEMELL